MMKNRSISISTRLVVPGLFAALLVSFGPASAHPEADTTEGFRDEINRAPEPYRGPPRSGAQVYAFRCEACHERATQGAPIPGDSLEWQRRVSQGINTLMQHVRQGFNRGLMPAKGGCGNCSDRELRSAVEYMLKRSGIPPNKVTP